MTDSAPIIISERGIAIDPNKVYSKADLRELLGGVSNRCIEKRVARKQLPKPTKIGRDSFWSGKKLQAVFAS